MEVWAEVSGFPQYKISPDAEVVSVASGRPKRTRQNQQGDVMIDMNRDGKTLTRKLSLLVAEAYLAEPQNETFNSVIHLDGDRSNCQANNLAWRPRWFVILYNRMFTERPHNVSVMIEETGEVFGTLREACVKYGLVESNTYIQMYNGDTTFPHGFHMKIVE